MTPLRVAERLAIGPTRRAPPRRGSLRWAWGVLFDRKARARREQRVLREAVLWNMRRRLSQWLDAWWEREFMRFLLGQVE